MKVYYIISFSFLKLYKQVILLFPQSLAISNSVRDLFYVEFCPVEKSLIFLLIRINRATSYRISVNPVYAIVI